MSSHGGGVISQNLGLINHNVLDQASLYSNVSQNSIGQNAKRGNLGMFSATSVFNPKSFNQGAGLKQEPSMHSLMQVTSGEGLSTMGENKNLITFSPRVLPQQKSIMQFDLMETSIQKLSLESKNARENSPNGTIDDNLY